MCGRPAISSAAAVLALSTPESASVIDASANVSQIALIPSLFIERSTNCGVAAVQDRGYYLYSLYRVNTGGSRRNDAERGEENSEFQVPPVGRPGIAVSRPGEQHPRHRFELRRCPASIRRIFGPVVTSDACDYAAAALFCRCRLAELALKATALFRGRGVHVCRLAHLRLPRPEDWLRTGPPGGSRVFDVDRVARDGDLRAARPHQ